jgi:hypothetical protein
MAPEAMTEVMEQIAECIALLDERLEKLEADFRPRRLQ